jgi:hypothetical protein
MLSYDSVPVQDGASDLPGGGWAIDAGEFTPLQLNGRDDANAAFRSASWLNRAISQRAADQRRDQDERSDDHKGGED